LIQRKPGNFSKRLPGIFLVEVLVAQEPYGQSVILLGGRGQHPSVAAASPSSIS